MPAIFANRSPKLPIETPRTRSPGESVLTIAASRPPLPAHVSIAMSPAVPKNGFMPVRIRSSIAANSGPRWLIIWRPPAVRTDGGRAVGPGIRRLGSKRSTGWVLLSGGRAVTAGRWSQIERLRAPVLPVRARSGGGGYDLARRAARDHSVASGPSRPSPDGPADPPARGACEPRPDRRPMTAL